MLQPSTENLTTTPRHSTPTSEFGHFILVQFLADSVGGILHVFAAEILRKNNDWANSSDGGSSCISRLYNTLDLVAIGWIACTVKNKDKQCAMPKKAVVLVKRLTDLGYCFVIGRQYGCYWLPIWVTLAQ